MRVLIVEDEPGILRMLEEWLSVNGYDIASATNGRDGARMALEGSVDLVVLDIMLPELDGRQVLGRIRSVRPDLPVLMLTARDELASKIGAFDAGADDYLTKPFALEELLVRVRALTRRAGQHPPSQIVAGDLKVDLLSRRAWRGGTKIELSGREAELLEYFMRHPGQTLSRQEIHSSVWEYNFDPGSNSVDVYVRYLRNKIDRPGERSLITTIRRSGYRFDPPAPPED